MREELTPSNPWFSMWTRPRSTIQSIVDGHPERCVLGLAALAGVSQALDKASIKSAGDHFSLSTILIASTIGGALSGILMVYIFGVTLRWAGGWLGGNGTSTNIRAAFAWSSIPVIWSLSLWLPELLIFGKDLFTTVAPRIEARPFLYLSFALIEITIGAWAFVVFLKSLGQVHGFSAWRALGTALLGTLIVVIPIVLLAFTYKLMHG